mgnify:CR=1 FL=1
MALLEIKHVNKSYKQAGESVQVLHDINASFNGGEFVSILGESGGGKSTLLNIIGGLDQDYEGTVTHRGVDLKSGGTQSLDKYRRQTVGFVFQSFNLISHLSIIDNVILPMKMSTLSNKEQHDRALKLLTQLGVGAQADKHPNQLSGGQKQRVAIARALASDPDILIADEPTGALDAANTDAVLDILKDIAKTGKLVIQVTHSITAAHAGNRIVHLDNGTVTKIEELGAATPESGRTGTSAAQSTRKNIGFGNAFMLALKHLRYNWKRNIFIVAGFAIGIFAVVTMLFLGDGIKGYMTNQINQQINPRSFVVTKKTGSIIPNLAKVELHDSDVNHIDKIKHVKHAEPIYAAEQAQVSRGTKMASEQLLTTDNPALLSRDLTKGRNPHDGAKEITLSKNSAKTLNKNWKAMIGKKVTLNTQLLKKGKPVQITGDFKVVGITKATSSYVDYTGLKDAFKDSHQVMHANAIAVTVKSLNQVKPVQTKIKHLKNDAGKKSYVVTGAANILDTLMKYVSLATYVLAAIAGISLLVSAFMIIVVMFISVTERTKEIGVLRALGATTGDVRNLFLSEALIIGGLAGVTGLAVALGTAAGVNGAIASAIHYAILQPSLGLSLGILVLSLAIGVVAALAPSRQAAKLDPIRALAAE